MTPSSPPDDRDRPDARPDGGLAAGDPLASAGRWAAAGCLGMIAFYLAAFALAIAGARAGRAGYVLVGLLVVLVAATALRSGGRRGRAFLARMAAGAVLAAVVGGALLLLTTGRLSLGAATAAPRPVERGVQLS